MRERWDSLIEKQLLADMENDMEDPDSIKNPI